MRGRRAEDNGRRRTSSSAYGSLSEMWPSEAFTLAKAYNIWVNVIGLISAGSVGQAVRSGIGTCDSNVTYGSSKSKCPWSTSPHQLRLLKCRVYRLRTSLHSMRTAPLLRW